MHEMSIAHAILTEVERIAEENKATKALWVRVKIGILTGVVAEQLISAFDIYKKQFKYCDSIELIINEQPLILQCRSCGKRTQSSEYLLQCTHCKKTDVEIIDGNDMFIEQLELDIDPVSDSGSAVNI